MAYFSSKNPQNFHLVQAIQQDSWNLKYSWLIFVSNFFCFLPNFFSFWIDRISATELNVSEHTSKNFHRLTVHKNISRHLHILHRSKWDTEERQCENVFHTPWCATECQGTCAKVVVFIWRYCSSSRRGNPGSFSTSVQYSPFPVTGYDFWHHLLVWIELLQLMF